MQAFTYSQYGSPDTLNLVEVEKPIPKEGEVLVKVISTSVNPFDWHHLRGKPFLVRTSAGWTQPKHPILGADFSGVVVQASKSSDLFAGDEVFGDAGFGSFAEYVCVPESRLTKKPANLSFTETSALPIAGLTALQSLRNAGNIQSGYRVLVNGASGGVGTYAVQLAKFFGAHVTGVCSTRNVDKVLNIGADEVVDYTQEDFTSKESSYDLILDAVGNRKIGHLSRVLNRGGRCVLIGFSSPAFLFEALIVGGWISKTSSKKIGVMMCKVNRDDLIFLKDRVESGDVQPVVDQLFSFIDLPKAMAHLGKGHASGKVVVQVGSES